MFSALAADASSTAPWLAVLCTAFVAGLLIGYRDLDAEDVQLAVGLLIAAGAIAVSIAPRRPWLTAIVIASGVPLMHGWATLVGRPMPYASGPFVAVVVLPMIPALIGAYGAAVVRKVVLG